MDNVKRVIIVVLKIFVLKGYIYKKINRLFFNGSNVVLIGG